jgi:Protein of unknown function (DUF3096)
LAISEGVAARVQVSSRRYDTLWPFAGRSALGSLCLFDTSAAGPSETIAESQMNITLSVGPLVSLIAGILILIVPRMLNYIVAIYLIIIGLLGLFGANIPHLR